MTNLLNNTYKGWISILLGACFLFAAGYLGTKNFLIFHSFAETFTIIVSYSIAFIVLNTYESINNNFIPIIGVAYFCAGFFDVIHTLSYEGLNIIPNAGAGLAPQMWIIARYLDSIGMLLAGISFHKTFKLPYVLITYVCVSIIALLSVFYWHVFPLTFIPGQGLTPFKVYSEYAICLILIASLILLIWHKSRFQPRVYRPLLIFFLVSIFTELSLTFYKTNGGWENVIGHLLKMTAYFFLYRAVVVTTLQEPYDRISGQAKELHETNATLEEEITERQAAQEALCQLNAELENKVLERTSQLQEINATLEEEIMERQAAEATLNETNAALKASDARYRSLFDNMQNVFSLRKVIVDEDGRPVDLLYLEVNPAFEVLYGLKPSDVVGKLFTQVFPHYHEEPFDWIKEIGEVALTSEPKAFVKHVAFLNGWFHFALYSPEPGLVAMITIDITARMKAEEAQKRYAEEIAATNQELQNFTNIVAHDFRSPMVNLKGFSKELGNALKDLKKAINDDAECDREKANEILDNEVPESLDYIRTSVDRLDRMVNALLKLARVGRREMVYKPVECGELITGIFRSFEHQIQKQGIRVEVGPMPIIETDSLALEQIISNLVDNAIKYLDPGRPGKIEIMTADDGDKYLFTVGDNGRGIAQEDCAKIFDLFSRVGKQDKPGEGLGLAYVRTLVRQLGGRIWCESELGVGTKMKFTIYKQSCQ